MLLLALLGIASAADPDSRTEDLAERVADLEERVDRLEQGPSLPIPSHTTRPTDWTDARFSSVMVESGSLYSLEQVRPALDRDVTARLGECLTDEGVAYGDLSGTFEVTSGGIAQRAFVRTARFGRDAERSIGQCVADSLDTGFRVPPKATRAPTFTRVHFVFEAPSGFVE